MGLGTLQDQGKPVPALQECVAVQGAHAAVSIIGVNNPAFHVAEIDECNDMAAAPGIEGPKPDDRAQILLDRPLQNCCAGAAPELDAILHADLRQSAFQIFRTGLGG